MEKPDPDFQDAQLAAYRELLGNARSMLQAAREGRWDDVASMDGQRQAYLVRVIEQDMVSTRPGDVLQRTLLIQDILDCDEQTGVLVKAWQGELSRLLEVMSNERKLANAYGE